MLILISKYMTIKEKISKLNKEVSQMIVINITL